MKKKILKARALRRNTKNVFMCFYPLATLWGLNTAFYKENRKNFFLFSFFGLGNEDGITTYSSRLAGA